MIRQAITLYAALALCACATNGSPDCAKLNNAKAGAATAIAAASVGVTIAQQVCDASSGPTSKECEIAKTTKTAADVTVTASQALIAYIDGVCPTKTAMLPTILPSLAPPVTI